MWIFKKIIDLQNYINQQRATGASVGFAPTMGALHAGHLSLFEVSRKQNQVTVCSIFVNPTQFNDPKDLEKYPRPLENDIDMLSEAGCDVLFLPSVAEIYPEGSTLWQCPYDFGDLTTVMEGAHRPGHFEGMVQVVERLLDIVKPDRLYMGQKDFQQQTIVRKMLQIQGSDIVLIRCPIIRERDGLAMSSRNIRLQAHDRQLAPQIYKILQQAKKDKQNAVSPQKTRENALNAIAETPEFAPDYIEIVDSLSLQPIENWQDTKEAVICMTIRLGGVRLLDNLIL